jgi:hypothetical protein
MVHISSIIFIAFQISITFEYIKGKLVSLVSKLFYFGIIGSNSFFFNFIVLLSFFRLAY